jgi:hypothetical protein
MTIDNATLLQVDVTALVGVLLFLTLQGFGGKVFTTKQRHGMIFLTSVLVVPFSFSASAILVDETFPEHPAVKYIYRQDLHLSR